MNALRRAPAHPELPEAARPRWPAWFAPVGLLASFAAVAFVALPVVGVFLVPLVFVPSQDVDEFVALFLLVAILVQDSVLVATAVLFAFIKLRPRAWHFGIRATRFWPTFGWAALAALLLFGVEVGWGELVGIEEDSEDLGEGENVVAALAFAIAVIVVAPVTEEFFFRGFFYRALRTRLRTWSAALIDGTLFGALHFSGPDSLGGLPVIALFGVVACLVYERTGSLFAVIGIHAAFNTVASAASAAGVAVSVSVGVLVLAGCVLAPRRIGPAPSPFAT